MKRPYIVQLYIDIKNLKLDRILIKIKQIDCEEWQVLVTLKNITNFIYSLILFLIFEIFNFFFHIE